MNTCRKKKKRKATSKTLPPPPPLPPFLRVINVAIKQLPSVKFWFVLHTFILKKMHEVFFFIIRLFLAACTPTRSTDGTAVISLQASQCQTTTWQHLFFPPSSFPGHGWSSAAAPWRLTARRRDINAGYREDSSFFPGKSFTMKRSRGSEEASPLLMWQASRLREEGYSVKQRRHEGEIQNGRKD